ncbi:hypothetical protein INT43_002582 [Umbelopsis isabellina]|uniref:NAD(P)-binding domain-containing protein n=1 Tax=Mortierella isabellina TaxID=91625 RepID=A0A8H7UPC7_MORIS|nr:hypothetical protein INT43_002582 [Umbelopsis isabellina]
MILITSVDQWLGHSVASHMMHQPHIRKQLRLTYQDKSMCYNFERQGAQMVEIDYNNENSLANAVRGVQHIVLAIGFEDQRVGFCKKLIQRANKSGVKSIIVVSHMGAISSSHQTLKEFSEIEEEMFETDMDYVILRPDWINQNFHLWSSYIERYKALPMSISADVNLCPIDLEDVCQIVDNLVLDNGEIRSQLDAEHVGQVYTLTGPKHVSGKDLVNLLAKTTGYDKLLYQQVRRMDMSYYLNEIGRDIWFDARVKRERTQIYNDELANYNYKSRVFAAPNGTQVQTYLDYLDYIQTNQGSTYSPHAEMLAKRPCKTVEQFFRDHANDFKPRV